MGRFGRGEDGRLGDRSGTEQRKGNGLRTGKEKTLIRGRGLARCFCGLTKA